MGSIVALRLPDLPPVDLDAKPPTGRDRYATRNVSLHACGGFSVELRPLGRIRCQTQY
jgi:hypothetical protein